MAKSMAGLEQRIKRLSLTGILASAAVILLAGLVVGLGAGYKIEKNRVKNDVNAANARATKNTTPQTAHTRQTQSQAQDASPQLRGTVKATAANAVTLIAGTTTKQLRTSKATIVVRTTAGTPTDVAAGARVVWNKKPGRPTQADAVIVLPANAKIGSSVVSATANSMILKGNPKNVTVSTSGATVEKVTSAKVTDISTGTKVIARTRKSNQTLNAVEIIVLPNTSKFVP